ncbi:MAG TPA: DUF2059 domain-containing protein [Acidobacteriaceae bacterium]|jgi:hypothetical protein|nr:DUF2059 domain-containing protein [Acidobacteriaceae bacterium]
MRQSMWIVCLLLAGCAASAERTSVKPGGPASGKAGAATAEQQPQHPATVEQVREIMQLTGGESVKQQMLDGLLPHVKEMLPYMPQSVVDDIRQSLLIADFDAAVIRGYQQHLSTEDAARIIAFYCSPAGKFMTGVAPQVQSDGAQAGAELGQQVMLDVIRRHQDEIQAAKLKYQQDHAGIKPPAQP